LGLVDQEAVELLAIQSKYDGDIKRQQEETANSSARGRGNASRRDFA